MTLANGRRRIMHLAGALKLGSTHVDAAYRFFMLAVQHNFTQGRRTPNVVAACLYIVCRRHKTPHMLIDFSDVLQANLFVLGNTFFRLCRVLNIQPPLIDPSLYIHRFAAALGLGDKENDIANTALRIVQRMKRDWIQIGRRPAGICGAALWIATRMHRINVPQMLILQTIKVCDLTLRRRINEFADTSSSKLSPEEFNRRNPEYKGDPDDDLTDETSENPPIFKHHLKVAKEAAEKAEREAAQAERRKAAKPTTFGAPTTPNGSEPSAGPAPASKSTSSPPAPATTTAPAVAKRVAVPASPDGPDSPSRKRLSAAQHTEAPAPKKSKNQEAASMDEELVDMLENKADDDEMAPTFEVDSQMNAALQEASPLINLDASVINRPVLPASVEAAQPDTDTAASAAEDEVMDGSDIPDSAVAQYLLTEEEIEIKSMLWEEINRDYLEEQAEKQRVAAQLEAEGRSPKKRARRPRQGEPAESPPQKEKSSKINWDAVNLAKQRRAALGTARTRHYLEGDDDEFEDDDHALMPPPPVRPPPSAFLGSLKPTQPMTQSTQNTTQAYGDDDDENEWGDEEAPVASLRDKYFSTQPDDEFDDMY